ncbi:MAG: hypothetical protein ACLSVD_03965 [Eggerthellaceae bacterium]
MPEPLKGALTACAPQTESKSAGASAAADDATVNETTLARQPARDRCRDVEEEVSADIIVGLGTPAWRPPAPPSRGRVHHRVREVREA